MSAFRKSDGLVRKALNFVRHFFSILFRFFVISIGAVFWILPAFGAAEVQEPVGWNSTLPRTLRSPMRPLVRETAVIAELRRLERSLQFESTSSGFDSAPSWQLDHGEAKGVGSHGGPSNGWKQLQWELGKE
jgi:hypothetical protein